jgi:hypothetical protein
MLAMLASSPLFYVDAEMRNIFSGEPTMTTSAFFARGLSPAV